MKIFVDSKTYLLSKKVQIEQCVINLTGNLKLILNQIVVDQYLGV